ncbi:CHAD domain-containing protein, partial [Actinacidiphila rubida]|uniref:CHAD domain-containing protein n=1 Tax=Actinacidiphila rubida TaxID=310780 RepID=UPI000A579426
VRGGPVGDELKWLAAVLGTARDREVLIARLTRRLDELDPSLVTGKLRSRLLDGDGATGGTDTGTGTGTSTGTGTAGGSGQAGDAHAAAPAELDGARYFALLDTFEALLAAPPYTDAAAAPAAAAAQATVRRDHARLRRGIHAAMALPPGTDRDTALHEARKDAKRARYSSEAAQPVLGRPAAVHTSRMKSVQQLLGEHQDSVMCRTAVAGVRSTAARAGEDTAPYDAVDRREREIAAAVEAELPAAWRDADQPV